MRISWKLLALASLLRAMSALASQESPMRFSTYWPCTGNGSFCGVRILAQGVIQPDTGRTFLQFLSNPRSHVHELPPVPTVVFDSPGGSVAGALDLGRIIRNKKMDTEVATTYSRVKKGTFDEEVFVSSAVCASACSLAFAGGVTRSLDPSARIGVHQFSAPSGSIGDSATQVTLTVLANYFDLMGVNRSLLDRASLVPPTSMYWLTKSEATRFRLDNTQIDLTPWTISATPQGSPILKVMQSISEGREVLVALVIHQGSVAVGVTTILSKSSYRADRIAQFPSGQPAQISLCGERGCFRTTPVQAWTKNENDTEIRFQAVSLLPSSSLRALASSKTLSIDDGFGRPTSDVSLATDLSVTGFGNGAALLLRQN